MRRMWAGWRLALRLGRREAWRAKWRSLLVVAMIGLPLAGVTAADVVYQTWTVSRVEGVDRRIGTEADARVSVSFNQPVEQAIDPSDVRMRDGDKTGKPATRAQVQTALGDHRLLPIKGGFLHVRTGKGAVTARTTQADFTDPMAAGVVRLVDGRLPTRPGEVAVNGDLAGRGSGLGDDMEITDTDSAKHVVGIVEDLTQRTGPWVIGPDLPAVGQEPDIKGMDQEWLVGGGPVTWDEVVALNRMGVVADSRSVVLHPTAAARAADKAIGSHESIDPTTLTLWVLIVTMVVLEVVLLAGPAFAVGARRQARDLALLGVSGGTPRQMRRVVLGSAVVLGVTAAVAGVVVGIGLGRALQPLAQAHVSTWFGPFDVPWRHLLVVAAFGLVAAVLAALVPAWTASRSNVVTVLSGRRELARPSRTSPVVGVLLIGLGVVAATFAAGYGNTFNGVPLALSALLCEVGLLFILPVIVAGIAKMGRRLPLFIRFAVRDADRHRTRTVPAIGAVAATVAGVVALGIGMGSNQAQGEHDYQPRFAAGEALAEVSGYSSAGHPTTADWRKASDTITKRLPGATVSDVVAPATGGLSLDFRTPDGHTVRNAGGDLAAGTDGSLPGIAAVQAPGLDQDAARRLLSDGGAVAFTTDRRQTGFTSIVVRLSRYDEDKDVEVPVTTVTVPATYHYMGHAVQTARVVIGRPLAAKLHLEPLVTGLYVHGAAISGAAQQDLNEVLADTAVPMGIYVERGYQTDDQTFIVQVVLTALGALLMIGGALTATFLALNDARPDLATLAAVGAAPRTRRGVGAAYALSVGLLGAIPGALIGFVPGIAATYYLTGGRWGHLAGIELPSFLTVPWPLIALVVIALPVAVALLVAATTRSRLPLVARLP